MQVEVLAPSYRGSKSGMLGGVMVHRFRYGPAILETLTHDVPALDRIARNPLFASLLPSYIVAGSRAAARIARDGDFDVVHAFWPIPHGLFALEAKKKSRAAMVSTFFSSELNWTGPAKRIFGPLLEKIVRRSDAVTVISSYTGKRLRAYVPSAPTVTIPFGAAAVSRANVAASSRSASDPFELLFVGRLVRRKGVDVLLRAARLLADDERLTVRIVGGGPEKPALEQLASTLGLGERVRFEGVISAEAIETLFMQCDALVLPAIVTETGETEGLGVVLIEAMGYGKLVIATSAGGIVDIVAESDTGLLVPPGEPEALADAIRRAMDNPSQMAEIAARGSAFAERAFGWDAIVSGLSDVYRSAVDARRSLPGA
jgi:glycosyltransferase involved in cell wall biosynthesis